MAKSSALPIVAGGAALLLLANSKKKKPSGKKSGYVRWGVRVSGDCQTVEIVNTKKFHNFLLGAFDELVRVDPDLTLIQITDGLYGDVAPDDCPGFPEQPKSSDTAELYAVIARAVGSFMLSDPRIDVQASDLIDEATSISFMDWYRAWRNYPSSDVPQAPNDQVAFSSDYSDYTIGGKWYEQTVLPFVSAAAQEGRLETAFVDFAANRGVLVGQFVTPIADLPQDKDSVKDFFAKLEEAMEAAAKQVAQA